MNAQRRPFSSEMILALQLRFGARCSTALAVREHHGRDESPLEMSPPDAVVFAESNDDVLEVVRLANLHRVPLIPFGVGSSLEGQLLAAQGGISLDVSRMKTVLRIDTEDLTATVQAGVTRKELNDALRSTGLFFAVDPGADASFGGMCATGASGTNAVRYGTMRENVRALTVVSAQGELLHTGSRARKSSSGYDLTRMFIGSEGTLGVITEVTVRLHPQPEASSVAICHFPTIDAAVRTAILIIQSGIPIARCELMDTLSVMTVNRHSKLALREAPMLLMEFHGSATGVAEQVQAVQQLAAELEGEDFEWAVTPEDRTRLWHARHMAYFAALQWRPGCRIVTTDVCVPISRLADCIGETQRDLQASGVMGSILGHVGDGNFHVAMMIDPDSTVERASAEDVSDRLTDRALAMDGTCTGEHGIGLHKMRFLEREHGRPAVALMRALKRAWDPHDIMNPGKIFAL
jgi:D-lactate dehydrogenase (cytochrome)